MDEHKARLGPGVSTTIGFLREVLAYPAFRRAKHTTALVDQMLPLSVLAQDEGLRQAGVGR